MERDLKKKAFLTFPWRMVRISLSCLCLFLTSSALGQEFFTSPLSISKPSVVPHEQESANDALLKAISEQVLLSEMPILLLGTKVVIPHYWYLSGSRQPPMVLGSIVVVASWLLTELISIVIRDSSDQMDPHSLTDRIFTTIPHQNQNKQPDPKNPPPIKKLIYPRLDEFYQRESLHGSRREYDLEGGEDLILSSYIILCLDHLIAEKELSPKQALTLVKQITSLTQSPRHKALFFESAELGVVKYRSILGTLEKAGENFDHYLRTLFLIVQNHLPQGTPLHRRALQQANDALYHYEFKADPYLSPRKKTEQLLSKLFAQQSSIFLASPTTQDIKILSLQLKSYYLSQNQSSYHLLLQLFELHFLLSEIQTLPPNPALTSLQESLMEVSETSLASLVLELDRTRYHMTTHGKKYLHHLAQVAQKLQPE